MAAGHVNERFEWSDQNLQKKFLGGPLKNPVPHFSARPTFLSSHLKTFLSFFSRCQRLSRTKKKQKRFTANNFFGGGETKGDRLLQSTKFTAHSPEVGGRIQFPGSYAYAGGNGKKRRKPTSPRVKLGLPEPTCPLGILPCESVIIRWHLILAGTVCYRLGLIITTALVCACVSKQGRLLCQIRRPPGRPKWGGAND